MDHPASYFSIFGQRGTPQGEKILTGSGNTILAWQNFDDLHIPRRAKARLSASKAAASETARRTYRTSCGPFAL